MPDFINIEIDAEEALTRLSYLSDAADGLPDTVWNAIDEIVIDSIHKTFDEEGRPSQWTPSKKVFKGGKTLYGTGVLYNSVGPSARGPDFTEVSWGAGLPYARAHQYGADIVQQVSPLQVSFFWAKWYETKELMWKALALKFGASKHGKGENFLEIHIPQRRIGLQDEDGNAITGVLREFLIRRPEGMTIG